MLHIKFGFDFYSGFEAKMFEITKFKNDLPLGCDNENV